MEQMAERSKELVSGEFEPANDWSDDVRDPEEESHHGGLLSDTSSLFGDKWSLNIGSLDFSEEKWDFFVKKDDFPDPELDEFGATRTASEQTETSCNEQADGKVKPRHKPPNTSASPVNSDPDVGESSEERLDLDLSNVKLQFEFDIDLSSVHLNLSELSLNTAGTKSEEEETSDVSLRVSDGNSSETSEPGSALRIDEDRSPVDQKDTAQPDIDQSDTGTICSDTKTVTSEEHQDVSSVNNEDEDVGDVGHDKSDLSLAGTAALDIKTTESDVESLKSGPADVSCSKEDVQKDSSPEISRFTGDGSVGSLKYESDAETEPTDDALKHVSDVTETNVLDTPNCQLGVEMQSEAVLNRTKHKDDLLDTKSHLPDIGKIDLSFDWSFLEVAPSGSPLSQFLDIDTNARGHLGSLEDNRNLDEHQNNDEPPTSPMARSIVENKQLITEMRTQNYDVIRFATYRTACKLRFLQKRTNLHLVDIWNMIEAFRENGLNSLDNNQLVSSSRLESLLSSIFYHLNKRLPNSSQIDAEQSVTMLHSWLMSAYDPECQGKIRVFSIKVALATLCSGKLMDKLRYIFTLLVDSNGHMIWSKFEDYLREVLALPTAVFEKPSFGYNETAARSCFDMSKQVTVNDFLDTLMTEPGPQCLMWQPILNRMATVENVRHPVQCEGCHRESFKGFRYKCERCYNYQLCQDCFWRGRTSGNHSNDHEVKEYSSYSSPAKELSQSLRKSFRCIPTKANQRIPHFPEEPEKTINLTHIVPPTPPPVHNGFNDSTLSCRSIGDASSMDSSSATKSPSKLLQGSIDSGRVDDEHRLIARYAARLAADANNANMERFPLHTFDAYSINQSRSPTELNYNVDANKAQRDLVMQLEAKNREIMREIQRLRLEQEKQAKVSSEVAGQQRNPTLLAELRLLRQRRDELEARMTALQESRRELMVQLEGLMKLLKSHVSPRSTPNSSPRARTHSPPLALATRSTPTTPGDTLAGLGSDVRQAFTQPNGATTGSARSLRNDLLVAADSVTNAMSSLVKELNSEASSGSEDEDDDHRRYHSGGDATLDELAAFREEMHQKLQQESDFLRELQARKGARHGSHTEPDNYAGLTDSEVYSRTDDEGLMMTDDAESYIKTDDEGAELYDNNPRDLLPHRYTTDEESCLETDQESYIRTDDEEGGNTEWEDAMRRWVNR